MTEYNEAWSNRTIQYSRIAFHLIFAELRLIRGYTSAIELDEFLHKLVTSNHQTQLPGKHV